MKNIIIKDGRINLNIAVAEKLLEIHKEIYILLPYNSLELFNGLNVNKKIKPLIFSKKNIFNILKEKYYCIYLQDGLNNFCSIKAEIFSMILRKKQIFSITTNKNRKKITLKNRIRRFKKRCPLYRLIRDLFFILKKYNSYMPFEPVQFNIAPTNKCNLGCEGCHHDVNNINSNLKLGNMSYNKFCSLIDQLRSMKQCSLYSGGESFFHEDIYKMIEHCTKKNIFTIINSNGHFYDPQKTILAGLNQLIISLDGASQETYQKFRKGGNYKKVVSNIVKIQQLKKQLNSRYPILSVQFIINKYNESEINKIKNLCKKWEVDELYFQQIYIDNEKMKKEFLPETIPIDRQHLIKEHHLRSGKLIVPKCNIPWLTSIINWDGRVQPCCFIPDDFGNVFKENFKDIWNNIKYRKLRKGLAGNKKLLHPSCVNCKGLWSTNLKI